MKRYFYAIVGTMAIIIALLATQDIVAKQSVGNNQQQLNNDVRVVHDFYTMSECFGFTSDVKAVSDKAYAVTLAGNKEPYSISCSNEKPSFIVFVEKRRDKKLYWKYRANGKDMWLVDSEKQLVELKSNPTPIFDTDTENRWRVSLDKGRTFRLLQDNRGRYIIQKGEHSSLFKSAKITNTEVIITLVNNKKMKLSRTPNQRGALEALYDALDGRNWVKNRNWKTKNSIDTWQGVTCDDEGYVTKIDLRRNRLKGELPDVFAAFPRCKSIRLNNGWTESENDNMLTGVLPQSMATFIDITAFDLRNCRYKTTSYALPEDKIDIATRHFKVYPQRADSYDFRLFIDSEVDGTGEIHKHLSCYQYQKATEGKGIDLYFIGDGFDAAHHTKGGTVDYWYKKAAEATFAAEPMNKLRKYYNIFFIYAHSPERGVSLYNNRRKTVYGYWQKNPQKASSARFRSQSVATIIEKATGGRPFVMTPDNRTCITLIFNSTNNSGKAGSMASRRPKYRGVKTPIAVALVPTRAVSYPYLVLHEFVGHSIGRLHDEYGSEKSKKHKEPTSLKLAVNLDTIADPTKCKWAQFYNDPRYADEKIGCYAGGRSYSNIYRATEKSMMSGRGRYFNAPSRAQLYKQTMERAYDNWKFDYEEFVKFDKEKVMQ